MQTMPCYDEESSHTSETMDTLASTHRLWRWRRELFSLRTCLTLPFFFLLIILSTIIGPVTYAKTYSTFVDSLLAAHAVSVDMMKMRNSIRSERMYVTAIISEIVFRETVVVPESNSAVSLLCSLLDNLDDRGRIRSVSFASLTERGIAMCSHGDTRSAPDFRQLDGIHTTDTVMSPYSYVIDPDRSYYPKKPREPWSETIVPDMSYWLDDIGNDTLLRETAIAYWNGTIPRIPHETLWSHNSSIRTIMTFTYPVRYLLGSYAYSKGGGTGRRRPIPARYGVAAFQLRQETRLMAPGLFLERPGTLQDRVLNLCPLCLHEENPLVFANNWGQAVVNDTSAYATLFMSGGLTYMHLNDVSDPLMKEGIKHVSMKSMDTVGYRKTNLFHYKGSLACVTAFRDNAAYGMPFALIYITPALGGDFSTLKFLLLVYVSQGVLFILLVVCFWYFIHACYSRPLLELSSALLRSSDYRRKPERYIARHAANILLRISEVDTLLQTYNEAVSRIRLIDTFIPYQLESSDLCSSSALQSAARLERGQPYRLHITCVRVALVDAPHLYSRTRRTKLSPAAVTVFQDAVQGLTADHDGVLTAICDPGDCRVLFFSNALSTLRACGDGRETRVPRWDEGPLLDAARQDALNALAFVFAVQESLGPQSEAVDQLGGRICHCLVDSLGVTTGFSVSQQFNRNQQFFVAKGDRSVCEDLGYLLPKLQIPICITEETFRLVRESVRAIPLEALRVGFSDVDEYGVVLYEALSGPVDDEAWLKYATHFCNAFGHMLRGDYESAIDEFDLIPSVPGLDERFLPHRLLQEKGMRSGNKTHQLDRLTDECLSRLLAADYTPFIRSPHRRSFLIQASIHSHHVSYRSDETQSTVALEPFDRYILDATWSQQHVVAHPQKAWPATVVDDSGCRWTLSTRASTQSTGKLAMSDTGTLAMLTRYLINDSGNGIDHHTKQLLPSSEVVSDHTVSNLGYSLDVQDCVVFITEWYPGGTLRKMMSRYGRVLPTPTIIRYIVSILSGLQFLHSRRVVHGDVRPETVLVGTDGRCKLTGFFGDRRLAEHVLLLPTSCYMSPEVARGGAPSAASDVYCAGLVLVEMLTGGSPWRWSPTVEADRSPSQLDQLLSVGGSAFAAELCAGNVVVNIPEDGNTCTDRLLRQCLDADPLKRASASVVDTLTMRTA